MKTSTKLISTLLVFCLLLTAAPLAGFTDSNLFTRAQAYAVGDHIQYGNYPQSRVTDTALIANLDAASKTWKSYRYYSGTGDRADGKMTPSDYMQFADFFYGGNKYRAVAFSEYRPYCTGETRNASYSYQDDNGYTPNSVYYFLYEPISWWILDPSDGLILSEMILDSQAYQNTIYYANSESWQDTTCNTYASDYAASSIRSWLNYDFYETAFTYTQKANIRNDVALNNDAKWGDLEYNSASTKDKIFLLSYAEATNGAYGFAGSTGATALQARGTDYAKAQGLWVSGSGSYAGCSWWWLRSPYNSNHACGVYYDGHANLLGFVGGTSLGVHAACRLSNLKSDISQSQNLFSETAGGSVPSGISDGCKIPVNNNSAAMAVGDKKVLSATIDNPKKQKLLYSSSNPSVVSVSVIGVVTAKALGNATITVQTYDKANSVTCDITVTDQNKISVTGIQCLHHTQTMEEEDTLQVNYNITPWNATNRNVSISSSNPEIAEVKNDRIIAKHKGDAEITVTTEDGAYSDTIVVRVLEKSTVSTTVDYEISKIGGTVTVTLSSKWFSVDSEEYQHDLARFSSKLMLIGYSSEETIRNMLTGLGFDGNDRNITRIYQSQPKESVNHYFSSREIHLNGQKKTLVIAGFIGSDREQWLSDFEPGTTETHQGFQVAANSMLEKLKSYIESLSCDKNDVKLLIFGHSRGGAVADLVSAELIKTESLALRSNIYTYAFAVPASTSSKEKSDRIYQRIFNILNPEDFVPKFMPETWKYGCYGTTLKFPSKSYNTNWDSVKRRLDANYSTYKKGETVFPSQPFGVENLDDAITWLAKYLGSPVGLYEKDILNLSLKNLSLSDLPADFSNRLFFSVFRVSFVDLLHETFLKIPAYMKDYNNSIKDLIADQWTSESWIYALGFLNSNTGRTLINKLTNMHLPIPELSKGEWLSIKLLCINWLTEIVQAFAPSHEAQTYALFMDNITEEELFAEKTYQKIRIKCPVDVEVIDPETGDIVARIINNKIDEDVAAKENALSVSVDGTLKSIVLPGDGVYDIIVTGNDNGKMDYSVTTTNSQGEVIDRVCYFDVPVEDGMVMGESVVYDDEGTAYAAIFNGCGEEIGAPQAVQEEDLGALQVTVETEGVGSASGAGNYTVGDYITLSASTDENNSFIGWYLNGELVSSEESYSFVIKEAAAFTARFTDVRIDLTDISVNEVKIDLSEDAYAVLDISFTPENATDRTFTAVSSDESIVTVSSLGILQGVSVGTASVTVSSSDGKIKKTVSVEVTCSHQWNEGEITKPATVTGAGERTFTCTVCGAKRTEPIEKLPDVYKPGDVDNDGEITAADARFALRRAVELESYPAGSAEFLACDVDHDGEVTASDARLILRAAVGLETL